MGVEGKSPSLSPILTVLMDIMGIIDPFLIIGSFKLISKNANICGGTEFYKEYLKFLNRKWHLTYYKNCIRRGHSKIRQTIKILLLKKQKCVQMTASIMQ